MAALSASLGAAPTAAAAHCGGRGGTRIGGGGGGDVEQALPEHCALGELKRKVMQRSVVGEERGPARAEGGEKAIEGEGALVKAEIGGNEAQRTIGGNNVENGGLARRRRTPVERGDPEDDVGVADILRQQIQSESANARAIEERDTESLSRCAQFERNAHICRRRGGDGAQTIAQQSATFAVVKRVPGDQIANWRQHCHWTETSRN
jgi:hypothetical protein